eukprot:768012-Hanusia_phi.AAC.4
MQLLTCVNQKTKKEEEQAAKFLVHLFSKVKAEKAKREKEEQEERYLKHYVIKIEGDVSMFLHSDHSRTFVRSRVGKTL